MRLRSALLSLVSGNAFVTAANLLRDVTLAEAFGAALEADVIFLAISIPVFIVMVSSGAFRSVCVPALERAQAAGADVLRAYGQRFVRVCITYTLLVAVALIALGLCLRWLELPVVSAGTRELFALLFIAIVPMYAFTALIELVQGPLQVTGHFFVPSMLRLGLPLGMIAGVLILPEASVYGIAVGGACGALLGLMLSAGLLWRDGLLPGASTQPFPQDVRRAALRGFQALSIATLITYANPLVDQWVAGFAGHGAASKLGYASRLAVGVAGLLAAAMSQVLLIHFSRLVSAGNTRGIDATYRLLIRVTPWLGCAVTLAVWLSSDLVVSLLYERGEFAAGDAQVVAGLLDTYALQFPIYWTSIAAFTLIWALSLNHLFIRIGVVLFVLNLCADVALLNTFGLAGIPVSTSLVYLVSAMLLNLGLRSAGALRMPLREWQHVLYPIILLALCGFAIRRFDVSVDLQRSGLELLWALGMAAAFAGIAGIVAWRAVREHGRAFSAAQRA